MFIEGRGPVAWWSWLAGGLCGVLLLLLLVCYCRLMPRQHKSFDEQYLKENHTIRENHVYSSRDSCKVKHAEVQAAGAAPAGGAAPAAPAGGAAPAAPARRPSSYAGDRRPPPPPRPPRAPPPHTHQSHHHGHQPQRDHYASSTVLEDAESGGSEAGRGWSAAEALKTRSLPAFLRPRARPRPLSDADADTHLLYSKVSVSKKHKNRMRSEHAAIIALSKSRGQLASRAASADDADDCDAVIVYNQRTQL